MTMIVRPEHISLNNWAGALMTSYERYVIPILTNPEEWQDWASDVLSVPPFQGANIPAPKATDNWQDWARNFYLIATQKDL